MNWKPHYTGIEVAEHGWLYLQRSTKTHRLQFARVAPTGRWCRPLCYQMLGVFLGRTNHLNEKGGEVFLKDMHLGFTRRNVGFGNTWSGSMIDPFATYTIRLGYLFLGSTTDKWLKRIVSYVAHRRFVKYWEGAEPPCAQDNRWEEQ